MRAILAAFARANAGAAQPGKIPVFGILKRGGKVHTVMIPDAAKTRSFLSSGRRSFGFDCLYRLLYRVPESVTRMGIPKSA